MSTQKRFFWNGKEWTIDQNLSYALDTIVYNLKNDWDFVILITGDRTVRVGKSVLAMAVGAYLGWAISQVKSGGIILNKDAYNINNVFFDNKEMVVEAQKRPQYSIIHYDEGREGLAANKSMKTFQQDLMDFFAECGQLNHGFIIVCPDFFELKENIAVGRSEYLINVYRKDVEVYRDMYNTGVKSPVVKFQRGNFEFFSRKKKALLFDISKSTRKKNYHLVRANFLGTFSNQYTIDETEYRKKKADSLARFAERHKAEKKERVSPVLLNALRAIKNSNLNRTQIAEELGVGPTYFQKNFERYLNEDDSPKKTSI